MDFRHLCRLCLCKSECFFPLFEHKEESFAILNKIRSIFSVQFEDAEEFPRRICIHCSGKIAEYFQYHQMVVQNQEKLHNLLIPSGNNEDDPIFEETVIIEPQIEEKFYIPPESADEEGGYEDVPFEDAPPSPNEDDDNDMDEKKPLVQQQEENNVATKVTTVNHHPMKANKLKLIHKKPIEKDTDMDVFLRRFFQFSCTQCSRRSEFPRFKAYQHHMRTVHSIAYPEVKCYKPECPQVFQLRCTLYKHTLKHERKDNRVLAKSLDRPDYICHHCGKHFRQKESIRSHLTSRTCIIRAEYSITCQICGGAFRTKGAYQMHLRVYHELPDERKPTKEAMCNECGLACLSLSQLNYHTRIVHRGEKPWICDVCAKPCRDKHALNKHHRIVHGPKTPTPCPICPAVLKTENAMRNHVACKHRSDPTPCPICSKVLRNKSAYRQHVVDVHQERRYKCPNCGLAFQKRTRMLQHCEKMH